MDTASSLPAGAFQDRIESYCQRIDATLTRWLPARANIPPELHAAMRYSVLGGGKRMRPLLTYAAGEALGVTPDMLDAPAAAVELIHAFSLVHDDLPAMDDDDLRRGRPTTHKAYGEATAILAGDALQVLAFTVLTNDDALRGQADVQIELVRVLADATGSAGMMGGQALDLAAEGRTLTTAEIEDMFDRKTGKLICASVLMACHCVHLAVEQRARFDNFASLIGLAFQIRDDILDVEGATAVIGKTQGADEARNKATYPGLFGIDRAKARVDDLYARALVELEALPYDTSALHWLAEYIVRRDF